MSTTQVNISPEAVQASQHLARRPDPCIVVIFGASGDLTKRKLLPALYHLEQSGLLPQDFAVVGVARRPLEQTFAAAGCRHASHLRLSRKFDRIQWKIISTTSRKSKSTSNAGAGRYC